MPLPHDRRWAVEVDGSSHNPVYSFGLVGGLECHQIDDTWLVSSAEWEDIEESSELWQTADAAVELVNQALAIGSYGLRSVSLGGSLWELRGDAVLQHRRLIAGFAEMFLDPIESGAAKRPLGDRIGALAARDKHFASAIAVLAKAELDLPALWVAFEHVEAYAGGENALRQMGWITRRGHKPFAETVDRVRHYRHKLPPPVETWSARQCRAYVRDLLQRWLDTEEPV